MSRDVCSWVMLLGLVCLANGQAQISAGELDAPIDDALRSAYEHESIGDDAARREALDAMIVAAPEFAPARWQRGFVRAAEGWRKADELAVDVSPAEAEYRALRAKTADDAAGHRRLAKYCRAKKLVDQAAGHWRRVLDFDPNDAMARKALGHVLFEGGWTTKAEIERVLKARVAYTKSAIAWTKTIPPLVAELQDKDEAKRVRAREALLEVRDAAAIPTLFAALGYRSEDATLLLLDILRNIPDVAATRLLAEHAVMIDDPQVLRICCDELKIRDESTYVPQLLLAMSSPITSRMHLELSPFTGGLLYRHVFVREGQYQREVQEFARDYLQVQRVNNVEKGFFIGDLAILSREERTQLSKGEELAEFWARVQKDPELTRLRNEQRDLERIIGTTAERAQYDMMLETAAVLEKERRREAQNKSIEELNSRVSLVLSRTHGVHQGQPEQWWKWWNQRQDRQQGGQKPVRYQFQYSERIDVYSTNRYSPYIYFSCFAAGVPVATEHGMRPIESLKTGDLVLAQDVETGEIAFKPVVRPTVREKTPVVRVKLGDRSFVCTPKHPFWKTGRGWVWASELTPGDLVRTVDGSVVVSEIVKQPDQSVHNLVVADFGTYFVGENRVLTHDISFRTPTLAAAPGVFPDDIK